MGSLGQQGLLDLRVIHANSYSREPYGVSAGLMPRAQIQVVWTSFRSISASCFQTSAGVERKYLNPRPSPLLTFK